MLNRILLWNCRGLNANYEETLLLFKDYEPAALCLQETHLKDTDNISIRNYTAFHIFFANNERAARDVSILLTMLLIIGGGRVMRWCWVNFQCRGVLQF